MGDHKDSYLSFQQGRGEMCVISVSTRAIPVFPEHQNVYQPDSDAGAL